MQHTVQPSPTPSGEPGAVINGDVSGAFVGAGVILLLVAIFLIFKGSK